MLLGKFKKRFGKSLSLIREFTVNDFRLKYRGSIIGYLWSLLNPLLMLLTLYLVFSVIMKLNIQHYQLFLLLGITLWNFFSTATSSSIDAINQKASLFQKIKFSKSVVIISANLVALITLVLNLLVFFLFMLFFKVRFHGVSILFLLVILELFMLSVGVSFLLTVAYAKFRDTKHIWNFLLLIGFWITPIIYPPSRIPPEFRRFYMVNPMARIITDARNILIYHYIPDFRQMLITFVICFAIFVFGYYFFKIKAYLLSEEF